MPAITKEGLRSPELESLFNEVKDETLEMPTERFGEPNNVVMSDNELLKRASTAKNGQKLSQLLDGDFSAYRSHSEGDQALCNLLAFWTKDASQIDRVYRSSKLCRPKWDEKHYGNGKTYGQGTIEKALKAVSETYDATRAKLSQLTTESDSRENASLLSWKAIPFAQVFKPRAPLEYRVSGLFTTESLNIIYGAPGDFKTMFMQEIAIKVASGSPVFPPLPGHPGSGLKTKASPAIWIDFDMGQRRLEQRFEALARSANIQPDIPLQYFSMEDPHLDLTNPTHVKDLTEIIRAHHAGLVVIDCLSVVSGGIDENTCQMAPVMAGLNRIKGECQSCLVVLHHQTKAQGKRAGDNLRGWSGIEAAIDLALHASRDGDMLKLKPTKFRDAEPAKMYALFTYEHKENSRELHTAGFFEVPPPIEKAKQDLRNHILKLLKKDPKNQSEIVTATSKKKETVVNTLNDMMDDNLIDKKKGPRNASVYTLKE